MHYVTTPNIFPYTKNSAKSKKSKYKTRVVTGSGYPDHPGHILSRSSGPDPLHKISGSDPDSTLYHVR